jgi:hypothetical protein
MFGRNYTKPQPNETWRQRLYWWWKFNKYDILTTLKDIGGWTGLILTVAAIGAMLGSRG